MVLTSTRRASPLSSTQRGRREHSSSTGPTTTASMITPTLSKRSTTVVTPSETTGGATPTSLLFPGTKSTTSSTRSNRPSSRSWVSNLSSSDLLTETTTISFSPLSILADIKKYSFGTRILEMRTASRSRIKRRCTTESRRSSPLLSSSFSTLPKSPPPTRSFPTLSPPSKELVTSSSPLIPASVQTESGLTSGSESLKLETTPGSAKRIASSSPFRPLHVPLPFSSQPNPALLDSPAHLLRTILALTYLLHLSLIAQLFAPLLATSRYCITTSSFHFASFAVSITLRASSPVYLLNS